MAKVLNCSYQNTGVDLKKYDEFLGRIKNIQKSIGGFYGKVGFGKNYLVSSTDGVGTKIKLATQYGKYDTIGQDLVAMNVNDIVTCGAKPIFFLDYIGTNQIDIDKNMTIIKNIKDSCSYCGCELLGGETAEMPGVYTEDESVELVGFVLGIVSKDKYIDNSKIKKGDIILGIPSSGVHSNGFTLVRDILEKNNIDLKDTPYWSEGKTYGEVLLEPTILYSPLILDMTEKFKIKGVAHITGGGILENTSRIIPEGLKFRIDYNSWKKPQLFDWLKFIGSVPDEEMYKVFNMGIGMTVIVDKEEVDKIQKEHNNIKVIGEVV